jgi:hypothetical protein
MIFFHFIHIPTMQHIDRLLFAYKLAIAVPLKTGMFILQQDMTIYFLHTIQ